MLETSFTFCLSETVFILPSLLMNVEFWIHHVLPPALLRSHFIFFSFHFFFSLMASYLSYCSLVCCLFLLLLSRFSFYDVPRCVFLCFILLGVLWSYWIWELIIILSFRKSYPLAPQRLLLPPFLLLHSLGFWLHYVRPFETDFNCTCGILIYKGGWGLTWRG